MLPSQVDIYSDLDGRCIGAGTVVDPRLVLIHPALSNEFGDGSRDPFAPYSIRGHGRYRSEVRVSQGVHLVGGEHEVSVAALVIMELTVPATMPIQQRLNRSTSARELVLAARDYLRNPAQFTDELAQFSDELVAEDPNARPFWCKLIPNAPCCLTHGGGDEPQVEFAQDHREK